MDKNNYYLEQIKKIRDKDKLDIENLLGSLDKADLAKVIHFQLDYISSCVKYANNSNV